VAHASHWLLEADTVPANLTGGVTIMGICVQNLVECAQRLDRPVHRFALVDRRHLTEQDAEPYIQSESHWFDDSDNSIV